MTNAKFAQRKCGFRTIITSKKLLEKINCPHVKGMVYLEELMESLRKDTQIQRIYKRNVTGYE